MYLKLYLDHSKFDTITPFPQQKKKSLLARRIEIGNGARQTKLNFSRITNLVNKSQKHTCISLVAVLLLPEFFIPF